MKGMKHRMRWIVIVNCGNTNGMKMWSQNEMMWTAGIQLKWWPSQWALSIRPYSFRRCDHRSCIAIKASAKLARKKKDFGASTSLKICQKNSSVNLRFEIFGYGFPGPKTFRDLRETGPSKHVIEGWRLFILLRAQGELQRVAVHETAVASKREQQFKLRSIPVKYEQINTLPH